MHLLLKHAYIFFVLVKRTFKFGVNLADGPLPTGKKSKNIGVIFFQWRGPPLPAHAFYAMLMSACMSLKDRIQKILRLMHAAISIA